MGEHCEPEKTVWASCTSPSKKIMNVNVSDNKYKIFGKARITKGKGIIENGIGRQ